MSAAGAGRGGGGLGAAQLETIERSRALLALNGERLNRQEAAVMRGRAKVREGFRTFPD